VRDVGPPLGMIGALAPDDPAEPSAAAVGDGRRRPDGPPSVWARNVVVGACIALVIVTWVGDLFLSVLVDQHPAVFITLNSRNRNLVLAKEYLDWWTFFGIGAVRLLISDPLFFLLGRWYGDAGIRWIEKRSATYGPLARKAEQWFGKASYPLILVAPNNYICLFAGASGMGVGVFLVLNVVGTFARLAVLWVFGDVFNGPLDWLRELITENRLLVFGISFVLVASSIYFDRKQGGGEVTGLLHIDEEIAEEEAEIEAEEAGEA
jgi:membrane protein DedA with SNARE-associated domain